MVSISLKKQSDDWGVETMRGAGDLARAKRIP
jgi:hypothetical protein